MRSTAAARRCGNGWKSAGCGTCWRSSAPSCWRSKLPTVLLGRTSAAQLAAAVPATQWIACSAGHGAKGRRLYDWTRVELAVPATAGMTR
jgi:hypothetical protein